jgi:pilus assembly protein TadC
MKLKWPKIDYSTIVEVIGLSLVSYGFFTLFPPLAFITLGSFLIWAVEKGE